MRRARVKMMPKIRFMLGFLACGGLFLAACGKSQDTPTRADRTLGGVKEGAPLGRAVVDPGILTDQTTYQPAKTPSLSAGGTARAEDLGGGGGGAAAQIADLVSYMVQTIQDGDADRVLRSFNPEHVAALSEDDVDVLFATFDKVELLQEMLEDKVTPTRATELMADLWGVGAEEPTWEILDADNASVSPNLVGIVLGPAHTASTMTLQRQDGEWRFQLDAPLTTDDVTQITAFHDQLQAGLDAIIDWLDAPEELDEDALLAAFRQARQGQPVNLEAGESDAASED